MKDFIILQLKIFAPIVVVGIFNTFVLSYNYPHVGNDMEYYSSRFIDLLLHFKCESIFKIQWWTPTFGGGIPAYASPGHFQFSVTPYLMFHFDPWVSTLLTCFIFTVTGYILIFRYLYKQLKFSISTSICSATVFATNGFWINHSMAGHVNYCTFMLIPIIPYLIYSKWSNYKQIIIITLTLTYSLYSGGSTFNMLFYLSLPLIYVLFKFTNLKIFDFKKILLNIFLAHIIIVGISASKLLSVSYLLENFSRLADYSSWQPYYQVFTLTSFSQLFLWRYIFPIESFLPIPADSILFWLIGSRYGFWENDMSLSPIVLPIIALAFLLNCKKKSFSSIIKSNKIPIILLLLYFWFLIELCIGKGFIWSSIKDFPVLRSLHVNMRFTSVLILFFTLIFSFSIHILSKRFTWLNNYMAGSILNILSLASFSSYYFMLDHKPTYSNYNISKDVEVWEKIKSGNLFVPITQIINVDPKNQSDLFLKQASSYKPNCPLYGYHGHYFPAKTDLGQIFSIDDLYYNFHDPRSFYAPTHYNIDIADKISIEDHDSLELLLFRKQPNWDLPNYQKIANRISLIFLVIFSLFITFCFYRNIVFRNKYR